MANDGPRRLDVLRDDYTHLSQTLRVNNAFLGYLFQERVISRDEYEELFSDKHTTARKIRILVMDYLLRGPDDDLDKIITALRVSEQEHLAKRLQHLDKKNKRGGGGKRSPEALRFSEQEHLPKRLRSSDKRTQETLSSSPPTSPEDKPDDSGKRSADDVLAEQATEKFLYDLAEKSQNDWKAIAPKLGFSRAQIGAIEHNNVGHAKEQCMEILCRWRDRKGSAGTLAVLKKAYEEANLGHFELVVTEASFGETNFDPKALLTKGMIKVARVRVNVIGQDGVGKTCLVRLLLGQTFEEQLSTCGIDMKNAAVTMMQYHCSADELTEEARETSTEWKLLDQEEFRKKLRRYFQKSKPEREPSHSDSVTETNTSQIDGLGDRSDDPLESSETGDEVPGEGFSEVSAAPQDSLTSEQRRLIRDVVTDPSRVSGLDNVILMRICDFGGQEPFLTAHAALMPAGSLSVYLLVFNGARPLTGEAESSHVTEGKRKIPQKLVRMKTNDDFLKHWSSSVHIAHPPEKHPTFIGRTERVKYPAIFLISTHRNTADDYVLKKNDEHLKTLFRRKEILSHFVNTTSRSHMFFLVENRESKDPTANEIRTRINDMTRNFYNEQNVQPASWLKFEDVMSLLKTITGRSIAKMSLIREVAEECCIDTKGENSELERALKHLTHVGSVFYFPEVDDLRDVVFYDSDWLINLLASFVGSAHSEPEEPDLKSQWQEATDSGFLSTNLVENLLEQAAGVSKDECDPAKKILDFFDILTENKKGPEEKRYLSLCFIQRIFEGQSEYSKAFSSDCKARLPPPLVLFVKDIVFFPESFFFRLATRFFRQRREHIFDGLLRRNRIVFSVFLGVHAEFLYQSELNCATLTVFSKNSSLSLSREQISALTKKCDKLRVSLAEDIEKATRRGMAGLQCQLYCQVRQPRDEEDLYDTLAETDGYDTKKEVWMLANKTDDLTLDERQSMDLWWARNDEVSDLGRLAADRHADFTDAASETKGQKGGDEHEGGKRFADAILAKQATDDFLYDVAEQTQGYWKDIAPRLGFKRTEIKAIEKDYSNDVKEQCIEMLFRWQKEKGRAGTLAVLQVAYKKAKCIEKFEKALEEQEFAVSC
ncbi:uncharacterized protein [Oscarella lobularis]|uniref:uncharacterized protein isoform X2 n=1 Tax=Oscarella lobularis TaxID=121494 RepID=UPI003314435D